MEKEPFTLQQILFAGAVLLVLSALSCSVDGLGPEAKTPPLTFSTPATVKPARQGGQADIILKAAGGELPYEFFVIPETQWLAGDQMHDMLQRNDFSRLSRYAYSRNLYGSHSCIIQVQPGSTTVPRYYWVAVQDQGENAVLSGTNMLAWWKKVAVYDLQE
ncbi:MAG TPA: hypothetical protein PLG50_08465 [bacterium]|nr:hypothetical protein [bacterium]HQG45679.1 hypothetical protein [bacterium]HQJ66084.1 hypothetical protein [bacterium]